MVFETAAYAIVMGAAILADHGAIAGIVAGLASYPAVLARLGAGLAAVLVVAGFVLVNLGGGDGFPVDAGVVPVVSMALAFRWWGR